MLYLPLNFLRRYLNGKSLVLVEELDDIDGEFIYAFRRIGISCGFIEASLPSIDIILTPGDVHLPAE